MTMTRPVMLSKLDTGMGDEESMGRMLVATPDNISLNLHLSSTALQAHAWVSVETQANNPSTRRAETGESLKLANQQILSSKLSEKPSLKKKGGDTYE